MLNGPGAAGIATLELIKAMGVRPENCIAVDRKGVLYRGRTEDMNQWKSAHAVDTPHRTLAEALVGRRRLHRPLGEGRADARTWCKTMAPQPIIFAMANPDPEITPGRGAQRARATPSSPPGAATIPTRSTTSWASPTSSAARSTCGPGGVNHGDEDRLRQRPGRSWRGRTCRTRWPPPITAEPLKFGPDYIIPTPFDPRLIWYIPPFIAQAAMDTGVARKPIDGHGRLSRRAWPSGSIPPPPSCRRSPARCRAGPQEAHRLRRGRGAERDPRRLRLPDPGPRQGHPVRPRGAGAGQHARRRPRPRGDASWRSSTPALSRPQRGVRRLPLQPAAAPRLPAARRAAADQPGPQLLRRLHGGPRPRRRHGHRRHPHLRRGAGRGAAGDRPGAQAAG